MKVALTNKECVKLNKANVNENKSKILLKHSSKKFIKSHVHWDSPDKET